ncbi:MAG: hypothetical protein AAFO07_20715 [Bacteroidota bacterium]
MNKCYLSIVFEEKTNGEEHIPQPLQGFIYCRIPCQLKELYARITDQTKNEPLKLGSIVKPEDLSW